MTPVKTRILFVVNTVAYGGLERHLLDFVRRTDPALVHTTILCLGAEVYRERLLDRTDVEVVVAPPVGRFVAWKYLRMFRRLGPDVIVFEKGATDSFPFAAHL